MCYVCVLEFIAMTVKSGFNVSGRGGFMTTVLRKSMLIPMGKRRFASLALQCIHNLYSLFCFLVVYENYTFFEKFYLDNSISLKFTITKFDTIVNKGILFIY